jgi:hypothetical protein
VTSQVVESAPATRSALDTPAQAVASVIDNATALARAELRLGAAEARTWLVRMSVGLVLVWLSLLLIQVFVLLLALTPVLLDQHPLQTVLIMLAVALVPALGVGGLAVYELRRRMR